MTNLAFIPVLVGTLALAACSGTQPRNESPAAAQTVTAADADAFTARVDKEIRDHYVEDVAAQWVAATYITPDPECSRPSQ